MTTLLNYGEIMKKYVILGGGTAGWITALYVNKWFPDSDVTVISNEDVGIIGVGEATTPQIIDFLNKMNINIDSVFKEAGATIKNGISFENWNGDGKKYFHGFGEWLQEFSVGNIWNHDCNQHYINKCIKDGKSLNEYLYLTSLSYQNKVDIQNTSFALHFDTTLMGRYLSNVAKTRGVKHLESMYKSAELNGDGNIKSLIMEDGTKVNGDFFFDCSGFARLLIGKTYNTPWKSYSKHLPMKAAIPYWTEHMDHIQPYTSATAMKYGWNWKIPLQHRNGCGYVYDSDYITADQAKAEVEEMLGHEIEVRKVIQFDAGNFEQVWVKNCVATGIASSFIEPLESTSIFLTIQSLETLERFLNEMVVPSERGVGQYNQIINNNMSHIMKFVYLHYMTKRNDSEFWKEFREKNPSPEGFDEMFASIKSGTLRYYDVYHSMRTASFEWTGYLQVSAGLELVGQDINIANYDDIKPSPEEYKQYFEQIIQNQDYHNDLIKKIYAG
jgi:tryptophan halogenase